MSYYLSVYATLLKTSLALQLQYRVAMLIWLIGLVVEPVIYLVVWIAVARARGGAVDQHTTADFAAYYIILMVVNHLTFTWIMWEYEYYIRNGILAGLLLRPIHPIHKDVSENLSYKLMTSVVVFPTAVGLALVFGPRFLAPAWVLLAILPVLALSVLLRFLVEWSLAMIAFWTTRVSAVNAAYFSILFFLSGRLAPIDLLPGPVQTLALISPFPWMVAFPVELLMGRVTPPELALGIGVQLLWCVAAGALLVRVWRSGVKRFVAVGS